MTEIRIARSIEELEELRPLWETIPWEREEAELDYLTARVRLRPEAVAPFGVVVLSDGAPAAALAARVDERRLRTNVGYKVVYAPKVRLLHVIQGGIVAEDVDVLADVVRAALRDVDAVVLPPLPVESKLYRSLERVGGPLQRQHFGATTARRRLVLPASFEEFVASRSANTRWRIHRDARRMSETFAGVRVDVIREPGQLEQLFRDAERVARATYQRAVGAGFADTAEQRELVRLGLERGWVRAYLLYDDDGDPMAFWLCSTYRGTMLIRQTGFDDAYAGYRVGIYLLMRVIEDAIADPALEVVDFGQGDAAYKQQFSSESSLERELVVFAPTVRGVTINAIRTPILGGTRLARRALDAGGLTDRVKSAWRGRLRRSR